jgi:hypothetical protein
MALFKVFSLSDDDHFSSMGEFETLSEARFQAERVADLSPTGVRVRIYLDCLHVLEVRSGNTQPSLWYSGGWI